MDFARVHFGVWTSMLCDWLDDVAFELAVSIAIDATRCAPLYSLLVLSPILCLNEMVMLSDGVRSAVALSRMLPFSSVVRVIGKSVPLFFAVKSVTFIALPMFFAPVTDTVMPVL